MPGGHGISDHPRQRVAAAAGAERPAEVLVGRQIEHIDPLIREHRPEGAVSVIVPVLSESAPDELVVKPTV